MQQQDKVLSMRKMYECSIKVAFSVSKTYRLAALVYMQLIELGIIQIET